MTTAAIAQVGNAPTLNEYSEYDHSPSLLVPPVALTRQ